MKKLNSDWLFVLTEEDAQIMAKEILGRSLSLEEMKGVKKGLENGLDNWSEVMGISIKKVVEKRLLE